MSTEAKVDGKPVEATVEENKVTGEPELQADNVDTTPEKEEKKEDKKVEEKKFNWKKVLKIGGIITGGIAAFFACVFAVAKFLVWQKSKPELPKESCGSDTYYDFTDDSDPGYESDSTSAE